jgi:hypothetical protein
VKNNIVRSNIQLCSANTGHGHIVRDAGAKCSPVATSSCSWTICVRVRWTMHVGAADGVEGIFEAQRRYKHLRGSVRISDKVDKCWTRPSAFPHPKPSLKWHARTKVASTCSLINAGKAATKSKL